MLRKPFLHILGAGIAALLMAQGAAAETLRAGTECTYHPFNYRDSDGNLQGYDIDIGNEVAKRIGADVEWVCQKWDGMIPSLLADKFDLIVASMSITNKRMEKIDFSVPYRISVGQFVAAKAKQLKLFNDDGSVNSAGFDGIKIGLQRATTYDNWIQAKVPGAEIVRYDNTEPLYLDLKSGRVDAIMTNPMKAYLKFLSQEDGAGYEVVGEQITDQEYFGIGVGVGFRQGNEALKARIDEALEAMKADGTMGGFGKKYFPWTIH